MSKKSQFKDEIVKNKESFIQSVYIDNMPVRLCIGRDCDFRLNSLHSKTKDKVNLLKTMF